MLGLLFLQCLSEDSINILFTYPCIVHSAPLLSQLLPPMIWYLNGCPCPKGKNTLSPGLGTGTRHYLQLKASCCSQSSVTSLQMSSKQLMLEVVLGGKLMSQSNRLEEFAAEFLDSFAGTAVAGRQLETRNVGSLKSKNCQQKLTVRDDRRKSLQKPTLI